MSLLSRLFSRKASEFTYDQIADRIDATANIDIAGVHVTERTALQVSTVLACVKAIADGCATPMLHVYRRNDDGTSQKAVDDPAYRLLSRRPNEWQTAIEWRRMMTMHAVLTGGGLSIRVNGVDGKLRELIPVEPGKWDMRWENRYERRFRCFDEFGQIGDFTDAEVFFLPGMQWEKSKLSNAVSLARYAIGLAMATERSQAAMHKNGLRPSGVYSVEGSLTPEQYDRLSSHIKNKSGPSKTGVPMILDRAAKWISTTMSGVDAQHVETRRLQIEEICRAFGVFPIIVGHSDKSATFASTESFFKAHLIHTLQPWHEVWRQRIDETLLDGSGPLFVDFDTGYMTQGSQKDHSAWVRTMIEMGVLTRNEIRQIDGRDPLDGLDEPLTPMNMTAGQSAEENDDESADE